MESETLRSRLAQLVQKSRKAVRLYSGFERINEGEQAEYTAAQLVEWQSINEELQKVLLAALDNPNHRTLAPELFAIRDRFYAEWRRCEADVRIRQKDLISAGEKGDFVKAAVLARSLVSVKAREQAAQAAHHELQEVISKARLVSPTDLPAADPLKARSTPSTSEESGYVAERPLSGFDGDISGTRGARALDRGHQDSRQQDQRPRAKVIQLRNRQA